MSSIGNQDLVKVVRRKWREQHVQRPSGMTELGKFKELKVFMLKALTVCESIHVIICVN